VRTNNTAKTVAKQNNKNNTTKEIPVHTMRTARKALPNNETNAEIGEVKQQS
jgi:hypothetical protein